MLGRPMHWGVSIYGIGVKARVHQRRIAGAYPYDSVACGIHSSVCPGLATHETQEVMMQGRERVRIDPKKHRTTCRFLIKEALPDTKGFQIP